MEQIRDLLKKVILELFGLEIEPEVGLAPAETGADYASNVAMRLAKLAHKAPLELAQQIQAALAEQQELTVEVAAPGFLNFTLSADYFAAEATKLAEFLQKNDEKNISQGEYSDKTVVVEFSDPNPFKVLHVGHLYTSVVGDSIARILEYAGAKVVRANFGGDVGLHVGKTIWALLDGNYSSDDITIEDIGSCYVKGTQAYEEDERAKQEITQLNKLIYEIADLGAERSQERLELEKLAEDFGLATVEVARVAELYWRGRELSYEYFKEFYAQIGVKFDKFYPESTVAGRGLQEVRDHTGTVYEESDGAVIYRGEKVGLHTRVFINREGVPTYEAKDVGLIFTKWDDWHFDESVVITGNEQTEYMRVVLASVSEYAPELTERTRHLTHGLVKLPGNVKMSSRKGNFLRAVDVLSLVKEALAKERGAADEKIVLAAIKYAFLRYKMGGDIIFDPAESVSMTGNSGVYLLYSAVRAKKVLAKVVERAEQEIQRTEDVQGQAEQSEDAELSNKVVQSDEEGGATEKNLSKKIVQYREVLQTAVAEKAPYKICNYLYELAQEFSRFYEHNPVAGSPREAERAQLVRGYLGVMEHGLGLLNIEIPEEM